MIQDCQKTTPNFLWLSLMAPYDNVKHAGGRIENFYLKKVLASKKFCIKLISFCAEGEFSEIKRDMDHYKIDHCIIEFPQSGLRGLVWKVINKISKYEIWNRYAGLTPRFYSLKLLKNLQSLRESGYRPNVILCEWTEISLLIPQIRRIFPGARFVCIEEDVTFQGYERKVHLSKFPIQRKYGLLKAKLIKKKELEILRKADLVILNNNKDKNLLLSEGISKNIWVWCPFFQSMINVPRIKANKDILYYGALFREENWRSVIWFIEKVFSRIDDININFIILGSNPNAILQKYVNNRIKIMHYVENISAFFQNSLCLVAPLVLGAGVKIKILEGLSSGIPVLTNKIGIEGIGAQNGKEYFFCETPDDYIRVINQLVNEQIDLHKLERNAKKFIQSNYDLLASENEFCFRLEKLSRF